MAELRDVLKGESPEKVAGYIKEYDTNGDGKISYEVCRVASGARRGTRTTSMSIVGGDTLTVLRPHLSVGGSMQEFVRMLRPAAPATAARGPRFR